MKKEEEEVLEVEVEEEVEEELEVEEEEEVEDGEGSKALAKKRQNEIKRAALLNKPVNFSHLKRRF